MYRYIHISCLFLDIMQYVYMYVCISYTCMYYVVKGLISSYNNHFQICFLPGTTLAPQAVQHLKVDAFSYSAAISACDSALP